MPLDLSNSTVFLSASVPSQNRSDRYRRVEDASDRIADATIAVTRSLLGFGAELVFGGHPSISPLVGMVAGEYFEPGPAEPVRDAARGGQPSSIQVGTRVHIYQSRAFEGFLPNETTAMVRAGLAEIHWTDAVDGERYNFDEIGIPQCPMSLLKMRHEMLEERSPDAMVAIGGMEGLEQEAQLFSELMVGHPIFVFRSTGGAALLLADGESTVSPNIRDQISILDSEERLGTFYEARDNALRGADHNNTDDRETFIISPPYAFMANELAEHLAG